MAKYSLLNYTMHFWTGTSEVFFNKILKKDIQHKAQHTVYFTINWFYIEK